MIFLCLVIAYISLSILIYIYIGYPIVLGLLCLLRPSPPIQKERIQPTVTLIISCYNEEEILEKKLTNSISIDYPKDKLEIIVVSDGSTDRTDAIALSFKDKRVRLIRVEGRLGKTNGLNVAVPQATGEIIVFSDANAMYQPDAIRRLVENFADRTVGYVVGEAKYIDVHKTAAAKSEDTYWQYEILIKKMESRLHSMVGGDGAIYAIQKHLYQELIATDINDFVNPLQIIEQGYRGIYEPTAFCLEQTAGSFEKEFKRKVRIVNRAFSGLLRMKEVMNPFNTGIFSLEIISHKLLRWFAPVFLICLVTSSILLAIHGNIFFQGLALGMGAGLLLSMIGYFMRGKTQLPSYFFLPYYFLTVNYASLVGIIRSLRGDIQITWDTVRSPEDISRYRNKSVHYFFFGSIIVTTLILIISAQADIPLFPVQLLLWSGFLTICYTYFGYPATLFCWSKINTVSLSKGPITPSVTLLICAYNEEQVIEQKIINSFEITYPSEKLTIAIASDGSSDRTNEIVSRYENENLLFFNFPERQGKIGVINAVVPQLDTEIIIFSDANTMYAPDAINKLVRNFTDPKVGAVSADVILHNEKTSFGQSESLYYTYERWIQQKETEIWSIIGADGGMYAIRRELFTAPSPNIILDDFVISMNVALGGHRVVYEPEAFGYEKGTVSHRIEFLRKSRVIAGAIQSVKQCEGVPSTSQIILLFCYLSHKFLRWMVPLLLVLIFLLNFHLALNFPGVLYKVTAALQLSFYLSAAFGYFLRDIQFTSILAVPFYFCLENGAALYGIYKGLFNKQPVTWKKFDRMK